MRQGLGGRIAGVDESRPQERKDDQSRVTRYYA